MQKPAERIKVHGRVYVRESHQTQADAVPEVITFRGATYRKAFQLNPHYNPYQDRTVKKPVVPPAPTVVKKVETERLREEFFSAMSELIQKLVGTVEDKSIIVPLFIELSNKHPRMIEPFAPALEKAFLKLRDAVNQIYQLRTKMKKSLGYKKVNPLAPPAASSREEPQAMRASVELQAAIEALDVVASCTDEEWAKIVREFRHA